MSSRHTIISVTLAIALTGPAAVHAQANAGKWLAALTSDSTAWQRILVYTVSALSVPIVASATDSSLQPWHLQVPANDPQARLIAKQLETILRMRVPAPTDTLVRSLELGPLVISGDTARVEVRFAETRRCPGNARTTGSGWLATVSVPRDPRQKFWGAARSKAVVVGDRAGC